jgi:hypothetical protein
VLHLRFPLGRSDRLAGGTIRFVGPHLAAVIHCPSPFTF